MITEQEIFIRLGTAQFIYFVRNDNRNHFSDCIDLALVQVFAADETEKTTNDSGFKVRRVNQFFQLSTWKPDEDQLSDRPFLSFFLVVYCNCNPFLIVIESHSLSGVEEVTNKLAFFPFPDSPDFHKNGHPVLPTLLQSPKIITPIPLLLSGSSGQSALIYCDHNYCGVLSLPLSFNNCQQLQRGG